MYHSILRMLLNEKHDKRVFNNIFEHFEAKFSMIRVSCEKFTYIVPPGSVLDEFNKHKESVSKYLTMPEDDFDEFAGLYALFAIVAEQHDIEISAYDGNRINEFFGLHITIPLYQGKYKMPKIYYWNLNDSSGSINGYNATKKISPEVEIIRIGDGIAPEDIVVSKNGSDLILKSAKNGERRIIVDWFKGPDYQIEKIVFNDGNIWNRSSIVSKCTRSVLENFVRIIPPDSLSAEFEEHKAAVVSKYLTMPGDSIDKSAMPYLIFTALAEQRVYISNDDGNLIDEFFGIHMTRPLYQGKYNLLQFGTEKGESIDGEINNDVLAGGEGNYHLGSFDADILIGGNGNGDDTLSGGEDASVYITTP